MDWMKVCHHLMRRNQDPYIVVEQEKLSVEVIPGPDEGRRLSLLNRVFYSRYQQA